MAPCIGIARAGERSALEAAAFSRAALDAQLVGDATLWVATLRDAAVVMGAFQRRAATSDDRLVARRGSGGPAVLVGPGTLHVALSLAHPGALVPADETRIVNRAVRPLLRALTRAGHLAHFFGRDWVSVGQRPVAWVGFAHDASTRRTLFEAFVAVRAPFAAQERASFLGKPHATLEGVAGRHVDEERLATAIASAYAAGCDVTTLEAPGLSALSARESDGAPEPPWQATCEEAIGTIGAGLDGAGRFRVGGDILVSRDALARLEGAIARLAPEACASAVGSAVDDALAQPGVALDGVRSLASIRDVIGLARRAPRREPL